MKILLFGNTGYVTKKFIQEAFPKDTVYLLGETDLKSSKKLKLTVFPKTKETILDVQSDENAFLKVVKVAESKSVSLNELDEIVSCFQLGV